MSAFDPTPFFSVVIPAYNAERFLVETLESVLGQTFDDFEVVVCDDASTDGTAEILERFGDRLEVLRFRKNRGPAAARNACLSVARGEYVAFIDSDDLWRDDKLERCYRLIGDVGRPFLFSRMVKIDGDGKRRAESVLPRAGRIVSPPSDQLLLIVNYVPCSSVVVRRSLLGGAPFDESDALRSFEDYMLWLELNQTVPLRCIDEPLVGYRVHGDNLRASHRTLEREVDFRSRVEAREWFSESLHRFARRLIQWSHRPPGVHGENLRLLGSVARSCARHPRLCAAFTSYYLRHLMRSRRGLIRWIWRDGSYGLRSSRNST